jgi:tetratricopeptide (TPR) repeat protein
VFVWTTENLFAKTDFMKSILPNSRALAVSRCVAFVSVMLLAALPAVGAGSAKQAVRKDGDPSVTIYNQGVDLMLAKRFPEAQAKFEQAVKENPRFAEAHNNLGYTLRKQGAANYQNSLEHYNTAIELNPKLAEAYMYRGVLYTEMGRKIDAQADLVALQKLNPQLAKELAEVIKTGKEEDRVYGLSSKIRG